MCTFKAFLLDKTLLQRPQEIEFSLVWTFWCASRRLLSLNVFWQLAHWNKNLTFSSSWCFFICNLSLSFLLLKKSHSSQENVLPLHSILCLDILFLVIVFQQISQVLVVCIFLWLFNVDLFLHSLPHTSHFTVSSTCESWTCLFNWLVVGYPSPQSIQKKVMTRQGEWVLEEEVSGNRSQNHTHQPWSAALECSLGVQPWSAALVMESQDYRGGVLSLWMVVSNWSDRVSYISFISPRWLSESRNQARHKILS